MTATDIMPSSALALAPLPAGEPTTASAGLSSALSSLLGVDVAGIFDQMDWAEQEIQAAMRRHPQHADAINDSFGLLLPNSGLERMSSERVYRAHCREILDRVAAGEDTRLGTAAEVCCVLLKTSLRTPIRSEAMGLYLRMWFAAAFPDVADLAEASQHHEALESGRIDEAEQEARMKLAVPDRRR